MIILGLIGCLIGGAMMETPIIGYIHGENGIAALIFGIIFGLLFLGPGAAMVFYSVKGMIAERWQLPLKDVLEALNPGFKEVTDNRPLSRKLAVFRQHYSEFLQKPRIGENEPIQQDVTQIFRNIMQLQKDRLNRLGLTCEILLRRMAYTKEDGITEKYYSDGKYDIIDVTEQVAAKTIYLKNGKPVYTKVDKELANYTVLQAKSTGPRRFICPNCGAETTREALLDGCDYCGTRFSVEDLGSRIAVFAFRPDEKLRYEKRLRTRSRLIFLAVCAAVAAVFLGFTIYGIKIAPELLAKADGGIILTLLATIFAVVVASPVYIISFLIVYAGVIIPAVLVLGAAAYFSYRRLQKKRTNPMMDRFYEHTIRKEDPNFSIANFYSSLQNKISSFIYAENARQLQAFSQSDLSGLLAKYRDVVGIDVDYMSITDFSRDEALQHADVDAHLILTRYNGKRCRVRRETMHLKLVKDASCKTQAVCAPAVMRCRGCGSSLDLLQGKFCPQCGRELDLSKFDWVIQEIQV